MKNWGQVILLAGCTDEKCERCTSEEWVLQVRTRDNKDHKFCKECLGMIVEMYGYELVTNECWPR